ncbi:MAG TPA: aldehyde ferredoxin oxidoreductase family protein [Spirochaetia bacterium]|nr:aldehyde ferredoxin oxidoreductase family protein [Spirochaetia bacterium]
MQGGYTGKILRINLSDSTYKGEPLSPGMARDFLGGAGFGVKILYDELGPGVDPLGEQNKLVFAAGPLTGTNAPCASRMAVVGKSPLTGAVGLALTGGHFPAEMKFAGYDALIIEGKAPKPTYLWIHDGKVDFRSAAKLMGTLTMDCQSYIKDELGDQNIRVACIGPAGEKLSKMACIVNERRAAGRKGLGAVMGSKNLKAIALRGRDKVAVAHPEGFRKAREAMLTAMRESPVVYPQFARLGTPMVVDLVDALGIFPTRNWSATGEFAFTEKIGVGVQEKHKIRKERCYMCPVGCSQVRTVREGPYAGFLAEGPEFETVYSFGAETGNDDSAAIIAADRMCDELGLDTISTGVVIGFAMELYEKGILTGEETGGLKLEFGNAGVMTEMIRRIAYREGLGEILADGVRAAATRIGKGSEKYAMHVKGLEMPGYDVRGAKAHGLNYATAYTGADHNRGYAFQEIFGIPVPEMVDRFAVNGKGRLCKWNQDVRAVTCDCATMCAFMLDMAVPAGACENTAAMVNAATGMEFTPEGIEKIGERVNNLARAFNVREGLSRKDDTLPERLMKETLKEGNSKGQRISEEDLGLMLDEYYGARGWDVVSGVPTEAKLTDLRLGHVADELARMGILSS